MMIDVKKRSMVRPAQETPRRRLWSSSLDLIERRAHTPVLHLYRRPEGCTDFFDSERLKDNLSRVLVPFYPIADRLTADEEGRIEIDCSAEGVLFIEAETASVMDNLSEFAPTAEKSKLIPFVDYSAGIFSFPLFVAQVTYFKCGSVSVGTGMCHLVRDGFSTLNFMKAWCEITGGKDDITTIHPFVDRTLLKARDPPQPKFHHVEYDAPPALKTALPSAAGSVVCSVFSFTAENINKLRAKADSSVTRYSSFEVMAGHVWASVCKARRSNLSDDQVVHRDQWQV